MTSNDADDDTVVDLTAGTTITLTEGISASGAATVTATAGQINDGNATNATANVITGRR